jgi:hypothetical protein
MSRDDGAVLPCIKVGENGGEMGPARCHLGRKGAGGALAGQATTRLEAAWRTGVSGEGGLGAARTEVPAAWVRAMT